MHRKIKITCEIQYINGTDEKRMTTGLLKFFTIDHSGKVCFFDRGRAGEDLLYWLFDNHFLYPGEAIIKTMNYDREKRGKPLIIETDNNQVTVGNEVIYG